MLRALRAALQVSSRSSSSVPNSSSPQINDATRGVMEVARSSSQLRRISCSCDCRKLGLRMCAMDQVVGCDQAADDAMQPGVADRRRRDRSVMLRTA